MIAQLPRLLTAVFSLYALGLVICRWQVTRVMTQERRFLLAFFVLEAVNVGGGSILKAVRDTPVDVSTWGTVLMQSLLAAYLFYAIPPEFRRWYYRFTRRN